MSDKLKFNSDWDKMADKKQNQSGLKLPDKYFHLLIGLVLTGLISLGQLGFLGVLDLKLLDLSFSLRGPRDPSDDLVIIAVDEESFSRADAPLALWSGNFAKIFEHLSEADARIIGFDMIQTRSFDEYNLENNQQLLEVIDNINTRGLPGLVFAYLPTKNLYPYEELQYLLMEGDALGYANFTLDEDKIVRRQQLFATAEGGIIPSFSLLTTSKYLEMEPGSIVGFIPGSAGHSSRMQEEIIINFRGPAATHPRISFSTALEKASSGDLAYFKENFEGKIVLIGLGTVGDEVSVAFSGPWNRSVLMSGVEVHANIIDTILNDDAIREIKAFSFYGLPFVAGALLLCFLFSRIAFGWGLAVSSVLIILLMVIWKELFAAVDTFLNISAPMALLVFAPLSVYSYRFLVEGREKRRLRSIFRSYVNDQVLDDLVEKEDFTAFSVQRKHVALMFTDVRNFTTLSEKLDPEVVAGLLNEYMTEMCKAIFEYKGTVNKFIGDGIMAIWGAPVEDPEACLNAVKAGLRMLERLEELNKRWKPFNHPYFDIGVGIHYAKVAVGYLGHPDRMEYTALGDGVNTASRVEGVNKTLKTHILITRAVCNIIKDDINLGISQQVPVKGRQDVMVYEVTGLKGGLK